MASIDRPTRRQFVSAAASAAGAALLSQRLFGRPAQDPVVDVVHPRGADGGKEIIPWKVSPFPMTDVRLLDGPFKGGMEANQRYLHFLPPDSLLHMFRVTANQPSTAQPLGGWEAPNCELRGHFAGGHYLSACALTVASTGDEALKTKANAMVAELAKCQKANGNGYLSAFPPSFFDRLRDGNPVWAPFYTLHKIMAGHLDMYVYCGNEQALENAEGMARWVGRWASTLSDEHLQRVLEVEQGGINEVLPNLYAVTGKREYLELGARFNQTEFFNPLADYRDELKGLHANTNIPKIVGAARQYELNGETRYRNIANFFWRDVTSKRAYCTGGTSNFEHWTTGPGDLAHQLSPNTTECCCSYNMLKVTRHIFGWTADPRAMDYYERTLFNSRLGTQDPNGMKMYYLPLASGFWKTFNTPLKSFWCCTGTGAEEFSKFNDSIYFHDAEGIYVNLFIASEVNWPEKGIRIRQETNFPQQEGSSLILSASKPVVMAVNIRIPQWATHGGTLKLNGEQLPVFASPSSYITLKRHWKNGDRIDLNLPMRLRVEELPGDPTRQAVMYGPLALAGKLGNGVVPKTKAYGFYGSRGQPANIPVIVSDEKKPLDWVEPVSGQPLTFALASQSKPATLVPLYQILHEPYAVYWKVQGSMRRRMMM